MEGFNEEYEPVDLRFYEKIIARQRKIAKQWRKRGQHTPFSRKWVREDIKLQRAIHRCSQKMELYGLYQAGWWVNLREIMLQNEQ